MSGRKGPSQKQIEQPDSETKATDSSDKVFTFHQGDEEIKVFLPRFELDMGTMKQIRNMAENSVLHHIRVMPDAHRSAGCCVGMTSEIRDKIVPNYVGVDIGCGISLYPLQIKLREKKIPKIEETIRRVVPMGNDRDGANEENQMREEDWTWIVEQSREQVECLERRRGDSYPDFLFPEIDREFIEKMMQRVGVDKRDMLKIGTLGGGNHYVEINREVDVEEEEAKIYLTVHSGSRSLGLKVCHHHQDKIDNFCKFNYKEFEHQMKQVKRKTRDRATLLQMEKSIREEMAANLHAKYLEGNEMLEYLIDMVISQNFASLNRMIMIRNIVEALSREFNQEELVETRHNYIDFERFILRKGSISAEEGEMCIISLNMRDGILLCKGKGNPDWNYSSAHGCGRIMDRNSASHLNLKEFVKTMEGVYSTSVGKETLDESPMAYRDVELIKACLADSIEIVKQLKPVINCKGV